MSTIYARTPVSHTVFVKKKHPEDSADHLWLYNPDEDTTDWFNKATTTLSTDPAFYQVGDRIARLDNPQHTGTVASTCCDNMIPIKWDSPAPTIAVSAPVHVKHINYLPSEKEDKMEMTLKVKIGNYYQIKDTSHYGWALNRESDGRIQFMSGYPTFHSAAQGAEILTSRYVDKKLLVPATPPTLEAKVGQEIFMLKSPESLNFPKQGTSLYVHCLNRFGVTCAVGYTSYEKSQEVASPVLVSVPYCYLTHEEKSIPQFDKTWEKYKNNENFCIDVIQALQDHMLDLGYLLEDLNLQLKEGKFIDPPALTKPSVAMIAANHILAVTSLSPIKSRQVAASTIITALALAQFPSFNLIPE